MTRFVSLLLVSLFAAAGCSRGGDAPATSSASAPRQSGLDLSSVDRNVRPQDDMFKHVNGGWLATTEIPADKARYGVFDQLFDKAQADLRAIIEEAAGNAGAARGSEAQKIGDFYTSYMDEARIETLGAAPIKTELDAIDRLATRTDLARYLARAFKLNIINPLTGYVDGDASDPTREIFYLNQGGLGLPDRDYYFGAEPRLKEYREKYLAFVVTMLKLAGQSSPDATAKAIVDLEARLAKSHWTRVESRDAVKTYNKVKVAELASQFPGFDWAAWTRELGIADAPALIVSQPSFVKAFAAMVETTPVDAWKPYLKAAMVNAFAPFLSKPFVDAEFGFYNTTLRGVPEQQPRWKRAVNTINGSLGEALGKLYVERHFTAESKARMDQLVANMRAAYKDGIDGLEWMSDETKKQAQEKLAKFQPKIGYPNKWRDYSKVEIVKDDLAGNVTRAFLAESEYQLAKVGKPIDREEWGMTPQTINAYYHPIRNEIVFPAAILQPPFFNLAADDAVNYGAIGGVIGHEMGHGFDDQGRRYDGDGVLRDWWTAKDAEEYTKRATALAEQYNQFEPLPNLHVNGELTLGENIGDLSGITIAHRAYLLALKGQEAPTIDGLTGDQRFYMGWTQAWRGKSRDDALRQQVMTDPHSPQMYRANGPLRNTPEFYRAFDVKDGDAMFLAPDRRVKIW